jgi:hypothetical protein
MRRQRMWPCVLGEEDAYHYNYMIISLFCREMVLKFHIMWLIKMLSKYET